jgi:hypothetical protein
MRAELNAEMYEFFPVFTSRCAGASGLAARSRDPFQAAERACEF